MATPDEGEKIRHVGTVVDPSVRDDGVDEPDLQLAAERVESDAVPSSAPGSVPESPAAPDPIPAVSATPDGVVDQASTASDDPAPAPRTGHPVRDRLLAKAAQARAQGGATQRDAAPPLPGTTRNTPPRGLLGATPVSRHGGGPTKPGDPSSARSPTSTQGRRLAETFTALEGLEEELDRIASPPAGAPGMRPTAIGGQLSAGTVAALGTAFGVATIASLFALLIQLAPPGAPQPTLGMQPDTATEAVAAAPVPSVPAPVVSPRYKKLDGPWRIADASADDKYRTISGKVGDEPFLKAIQDAGLEKPEAYRVYTALKNEKNLDKCDRSDEFFALLDRSSGRVHAFEYVDSKEEVYQARENADNLLVGKQLDLKVERHRVQGAFAIAGDFVSSAASAGFQEGLGSLLNRALEGHLTIKEVHPADTFRLILQEVTVLGEFSRYAGLEAMEYRSSTRDAPLRIYYFPGPRGKRYVDAKGRAPGEGGWRKPVKGAPITSRFNPKRMHPILKRIRPHTGTDFGASTGTPVGATRAGTVTFMGNAGANGNFVAIRHEAGYESSYSHLSRFEKGLKAGDKVKTMQIIGYVGSTGRSTGPHLHFSIKKNGQFIDPESVKLDALSVLPVAERKLFAQVRNKYDGLLDEVPLPPPPPNLAQAAPTEEVTDDDMHGDDDGPEMAVAAVTNTAQPAAAANPTPGAAPAKAAANSPAPAAPATAAPNAVTAPAPGGAIYLTDKELMQSQPATDEDEVDE